MSTVKNIASKFKKKKTRNWKRRKKKMRRKKIENCNKTGKQSNITHNILRAKIVRLEQ